jgi:hypothetical protein
MKLNPTAVQGMSEQTMLAQPKILVDGCFGIASSSCFGERPMLADHSRFELLFSAYFLVLAPGECG